MEEQFLDYIRSIGIITTVLQNRIKEIYESCREMCPEEVTGIFVTEYLNQDGSREYENLWFFSKTYVMEAKNFAHKDGFDIATVNKKIEGCGMESESYDFKHATEKSRLHVRFFCNSGSMFGNLKASGENCKYLRDVIQKYLIANLQE